MKLFKYLMMGAIVAAGFTACDEDDDYAPGAPAGDYEVNFVDPGTLVADLSATSVDVTLKRASDKGELIVPIEVIEDNGFSVPTSAKFEDGATETSISISFPEDMKVNTIYNISFRIPEEFTNPYKVSDAYPVINLSVMKEDYELFKKADYESPWFWEDTFEVDVLYSPSQNLYRISDLYVEGYSLFFAWDKVDNIITITDASGKKVSYFDTGVLQTTYGENIVGLANQQEFTYDPETDTITLNFYWYLVNVGGGWGIHPDYIHFK